MDSLWSGLGVGFVFLLPLLGVAAILHGFRFITIEKHYHYEISKKSVPKELPKMTGQDEFD